MINYETVCADGDRLGEYMDCALVATAVATQTPYPEIHRRFTAAGRKPKRRTRRSITNRVIDDLGFDLKTVFSRGTANRGYTYKTIGKAFPRGTYLVFVKGHVYALVDGKVHDACDMAQRVQMVFKVEQRT